MIDHLLEELLVAQLSALPAIAETRCYTAHDNAEHKLPPLTVTSTQSEALAGSASVFPAEVEIMVESEAHDTTPISHADRVEAVRCALANRSQFISAINATNGLHIYGCAPLGSEQSAGDARFTTKLKYCFGFGSA